mmetsp:Transcript_22668/g.63710  ORF Transcript_22668/g.63710 Transcript_22668/m.63710 type:complete len:331 (+) Transcript_22668:139-1131(+)|eukprot:CAMPEP_0119121018 /NCGR_PEP_ID=MMETSP1310-20130426/1827_1 /TAXON_ID=464262 /ORGANISM="Genus nov. species nov., Strain RCC2339" /LENGTH=330 /DNA_ID=CAMNT_0007110549 /DNA_START=106 /DNA_END=1098 /DNA_ORIENTATION=-
MMLSTGVLRRVMRGVGPTGAHASVYARRAEDGARTHYRHASTGLGKPRVLVIDGYAPAGREDLVRHGASEAGILYKKMVEKVSPTGCDIDIVYPADPGFEAPSNLGEYDGICWTGSSLTIFHDDPKVHAQISLAKRITDAKVPSFGSCWSVQMAAVANGGIVAKNPKGRAMGIGRKVQLTDVGRAHPMFEGKSTIFDTFCSHEDEVTHEPPTGLVLATNKFARVQAMAVTVNGAEFWAVQYHPEYDLKELARLTYARIEKLTKMGFFTNRESAEQYVKDIEALHEDPSRKDIAWKYGIDMDVMSEDVRLVEVKNWVKYQVLPFRRNRLGL